MTLCGGVTPAQLSTHTTTCLLPPQQDDRENKAKVRKFIGEDKDRSISAGNGEREQVVQQQPLTTAHKQTDAHGL